MTLIQQEVQYLNFFLYKLDLKTFNLIKGG